MALSAFAFVSCLTDDFIDCSLQDEQPVAISIAAGVFDVPVAYASETRPGTVEDDKIGSMRVLGFRSDGTLAFNDYNEDMYAQTRTFKALTGRYTLLFLANEDSDRMLHETLDGLDPKTDATITLDEVGALSFSHGAFSTDENTHIPMVKLIHNVRIAFKEDGEGTPRPGITNQGDTLAVSMERLGVKIDVALKLYENQFKAWSENSDENERGVIHIENLPDHVHLLQGDNSDGEGLQTQSNAPYYAPGDVVVDTYTRQSTILLQRAFILPESWFIPATDSDKAMRIRINTGVGTWNGRIAVGDARTYAVRRNSHLLVSATSDRDSVRFNALEIPDWNTVPIGDVTVEEAYYDVKFTYTSAEPGGSAMTNLSRARQGDTVTVMAIPESGNMLARWTFSPAVVLEGG